MDKNLNKLAKKIIKENEYLTLATVDEVGKPWVSIMAYSYDDKYNFYFVSLPSSRHSAHIRKNNSISFSIFDSHQPFGYGVGLQIEGTIKEAEENEYDNIKKVYLERSYPYGNVKNDFTDSLKKLIKDRVYRFYKIKPTVCWINDPNANTDIRVKVNLSLDVN